MHNNLNNHDIRNQIIKILDFPELRQVFNFDCGASAFQSVLTYYGFDKREDELIKQLKTHHTDIFNDGVRIVSIKALSEYYGLECIIEKGLEPEDLTKFIDEDIPVIILIQAFKDFSNTKSWTNEYNSGHYVVAIGHSKDKIIFEDPASFVRTYLTFKELKNRWHGINDKNQKDPITTSIIIIGNPKFKSLDIVHMD